MRNDWINGRTRIAQRGASPPALSATDGYTLDRWFIGVGDTGTFTHTVTRQALNTGLAVPRRAPSHFIRWAVTNTPGTGTCSIGTRIPGVRTLSGRHVFVSFAGKADRAFSANFACNQNFGTGGTPDSEIPHTGLLMFNFTTSWQEMGGSFYLDAIPLASSLGTDGNDYINPRITVNGATQFTADTIVDIADMQISVEGNECYIQSTQQDLDDCKWFFERVGGELADVPLANGFANSTTHAFCVLRYAEKRALPTITINGTVGTDFELAHTGGVVVPTGITVTHIGLKAARIDVEVAAGLTPGEALTLKAKTTTGTIDVSAEL